MRRVPVRVSCLARIPDARHLDLVRGERDRLEQVAEAIAGYERYLGEIPAKAPDATEVRERIVVLKQRLAGSTPAIATPPPVVAAPMLEAQVVAKPAATPAPPILVETSGSESLPLLKRPRRYTWIVGGAGLALLAGSLVSGLVANSRYGDLKSNCAPDGACDGVKLPDAQSWIDNGHSAGIASDVLLGVGVAAVAASVAFFFVEGKPPRERHAWRLAPMVNASGAGIAFEASP